MTNEMNSMFDDLNLDDHVEPQTFDDGAEVTIDIIDAEAMSGESEKGPWSALKLTCVPTGFEALYPEITNPKTIYHMIFGARADSTAKQKNFTLGNLKRIYASIGEYPAGGKPNPEDFRGKQATVLLGVDSYNEEPQNKIKRWLAQ